MLRVLFLAVDIFCRALVHLKAAWVCQGLSISLSVQSIFNLFIFLPVDLDKGLGKALSPTYGLGAWVLLGFQHVFRIIGCKAAFPVFFAWRTAEIAARQARGICLAAPA